ncbi:MAG: hypothetical protein ACI8W3_003421 [Myxococcota bacterium]
MIRTKAVQLLQVLLTLALLGFAAPAAHAGGKGVYLEGEFASSNLDDHGINRSFDAKMGGLGFLYDGNVEADNALNYRLQFGYRLGKRELDKHSDQTVNGLTLDNTLGYGLLRSELVRVWAGPSLRLNVDWYSSVGDVDIVDVGVGIGPRIGMNMHLTDTLSLTTSVAYHYMYLSELLESEGVNRTIDGPQHIVGVNIGFLWRGVNDVWED